MPVYLDHDGAVEDFLALQLLIAQGAGELIGVGVTPADCLLEPAVTVTRRLLALNGVVDVPVARGVLDGLNPFPLAWRLDAVRVSNLPHLHDSSVDAPIADVPAHMLLARRLLSSPEPVTLVFTGPLTNLARCLDNHPGIEQKIDRLVFMGGALDVEGNVDVPGHDGTAEWNVFWDPRATARVWDSTIPITLVPLDATNRVPVSRSLVARLAQSRRHATAHFAATLWAMTFGTLEATGMEYCCWDTLAVASLAVPEVLKIETVGCEVIPDGPGQGRTLRSSDGRSVDVAVSCAPEVFYEHCVRTFAGARWMHERGE